MRTANLDIRVNRNGDYNEEWQLKPWGEDGGINLTGCTIDLKIRRANGSGNVVASGSIDLVEPLDGRFVVTIRGSDFGSVGSGREVVVLSYDLRVIYPDGIKAVPVSGNILLTPGATY